MTVAEYDNLFDVTKCQECGLCLSRCPVLRLSPEEARREKARINRGDITPAVSRKCTSCFGCDFICPQGANPCETIMQTWWEESRRTGILARARFFLPTEKDNFRSYVTARMARDEQALLSRWNDERPCAEFVYPGCNVCTVPYLIDTRLLPAVPVRGGLEWCCGEMLFRMGLYDVFAQQGRRMQDRFARMGARRIHMLCTAGTFIFSRVLPDRFGIKLDAEFLPLLQTWWDGLESGRIRVTKPLGLSATVQDSCYAKFLGREYFELPRRILARIGVTVREMPGSGCTTRCCGIGGGFSIQSGFHVADLTQSVMRVLLQAKGTGADVLCTYCAGCMQMLGTGATLLPRAPEIYHLLELLQLATGETPKRRLKERARLMLIGVARHEARSVLAPKRFFPRLK